MKRLTFDGNFCDIAKCADVCEDDEIYYWTLEDDDEPFEVEDIGKTVFLSREDAEKALEEMEEKGNG